METVYAVLKGLDLCIDGCGLQGLASRIGTSARVCVFVHAHLCVCVCVHLCNCVHFAIGVLHRWQDAGDYERGGQRGGDWAWYDESCSSDCDGCG